MEKYHLKNGLKYLVNRKNVYLKIKIIAIYQIEVVRNVFKIATNARWLVAERRITNKHYKHKIIINQRWQGSLK